MNTLNGYSKSTLSNDYLLTASGGHLPKSDLFRKLGTNLDINTFADSSNKNGIIYINTATPNDINAPFGYGSILSLNNSASSWMVACSADGTLSYRSRWWSGNGNDWSDWKTLLTTNGGALTGPLVLNGSDTNRNLIRVNCETGDANKIGNWGYTLKYLGSGTGINNALALYADNSEATTQNLATKWLNDGTMYSRSIIPHSNATYDLGTNDIKWNNIYGTTIYENGTSLVSKYQVKGSYAKTNNNATTAVGIASASETGIYYVNGTSDILGQQDGALITNKYSDSWISQIYQDYRTGKIALRGKNNGTWQPWLKPSYEGHTHDYLPLTGGVIKNGDIRNPLTIDTTNEVGSYINFAANGIAKAYVGYHSSVGVFMELNSIALKLKDGVATLGNYIMLHSGNYNSYAPKLDGTGASGTWGINITGSATTASYLPEANLTWGGKNFAASWGPLDAAMIPELGSNRLEYYPGSKIKIEYSTNNGSTWSASTLSEAAKSQIFSSGYSIYLGGSSAINVDKSQYQTRITLTTASTLYSILNKFAIRISTSGSSNCWCSIDVRLQSNVENNTDTWVNVANKVTINGWSGWNIINIPGGFVTYGNQKASQYGEIRFTFGATHSSSSEYSGLTILRIKGFGGEGWTTPSNKALTGTIYTENSDQTTIWPNTLYPWSNKTSNLGVSTRYWNNIYAGHVFIGGTADNTTSKITSDTATNMYFDVGNVIALMVLNGSDKTIRSGAAHANTVNLGASNVPFKSLYANDAHFSKALTLTGIAQDTACINFSRSTNVASYGYNYITAPVGGIISIQPGLTPSSSTGYHFTSTEIIPGATNTYSLGTSSLQFKNVYATTFYGNLDGNFSGVSFSSGNSSNKSHDCNEIKSNGVWYYSANGPSTTIGAHSDGALYSQAYSNIWVAQIAQNYRNGDIFTRGLNNGTWTSWKAVAYADHNHNDVYKPLQTPVVDPNTDTRPAITFIDTITQNANGVISATKKTVPVMTGASTRTSGISGLVPAPTIENIKMFLKGDGSWAMPENATTRESGFMSAEDKTKLDEIDATVNIHYGSITSTVSGQSLVNPTVILSNNNILNPYEGMRLRICLNTNSLPSLTPSINFLSFNIGILNNETRPISLKSQYDTISECLIHGNGFLDLLFIDENNANILVNSEIYKKYFICDTDSRNQTKTITLNRYAPPITIGTEIFVKFTNFNNSGSPILRLNGVDREIKCGSLTFNNWIAGQVIHFIYDGSCWQVLYRNSSSTAS